MKLIFRITILFSLSFILFHGVYQTQAKTLPAQTGTCELQLIFVVDTSLVGGNAAVYNTITSNLEALLRYITEYSARLLPNARILITLNTANGAGVQTIPLLGTLTQPVQSWIDLQATASSGSLPLVYENLRTRLPVALTGQVSFPSLAHLSGALDTLRANLPPPTRRALFYFGSGKMQEDWSTTLVSQWDNMLTQTNISDVYFLGTANDMDKVGFGWAALAHSEDRVAIPRIGDTPQTNQDGLLAPRFLFALGLRHFEELVATACNQTPVTRLAQNNEGVQEWKFTVLDGQSILRLATAYDLTLAGNGTANAIRLFGPDGTEIAMQSNSPAVRRFDREANILIWEILNPPPGAWRAERLAKDFYNDPGTPIWGHQYLHIQTIPYNSPGHATAKMQVTPGQVFVQAANSQPTIFHHQRMSVDLVFEDGDPRINPLNGQQYGMRAVVEVCAPNNGCFPISGGVEIKENGRPNAFQVFFPVSIIPASTYITDIQIEVFINISATLTANERSIGKFAVQHEYNTPMLLQVAEVNFASSSQSCIWNGGIVYGEVLISATDPNLNQVVAEVNWLAQITSQAALTDQSQGAINPAIPPTRAYPIDGTGYVLVWEIAGVTSPGPLFLSFEFGYPGVGIPFNNGLNCNYPGATTATTGI